MKNEKCSPDCPHFKAIINYDTLGYCALTAKDNCDPLDGLVHVGLACEIEEGE